jgi:hypothetical protein
VDHRNYPLVSLQMAVEFTNQEKVPHQLCFERRVISEFIIDRRPIPVRFSDFKRVENRCGLRGSIRIDVLFVHCRKVLCPILFLLPSNFSKDVLLKRAGKVVCIREVKALRDFYLIKKFEVLFFITVRELVDTLK